MYIKGFIQHNIYEADDLTTEEKIEGLNILETLSVFGVKTILTEASEALSEGGGVEDDIANYYKHRNKLRKIGLRKGVKNPGVAKSVKATKVAKVAKVVKGGAAKKSFGKKLVGKLLTYAQKKGLLAKAAKLAKLAGKTM